MAKTIPILIGKTTRLLSKFRGNGSALPGYVIERISPNFISFLDQLPHGVVVVSGTNGKTTTTKIITEILRAGGLRVFTNETGSNFARGVISSAIPHFSMTGKFPFDIAVLELDEAHAVRFSEQVKPTYSLLLNVAPDQMDRFDDTDQVGRLMDALAQNTTNTVIINREDYRLAKIKTPHTIYYGLSNKLLKTFIDDSKPSKNQAAATLQSFDDGEATYKIDEKNHDVKLKLKGIYNAYNAAGAIATVRSILPDLEINTILKALAHVTSPDGRGEEFTIDGKKIELFLIKNPSAFQLALTSFADHQHDYIIAINDNIPDGTNISWLDSVDFSALPSHVLAVTGIRAEDMAKYLEKYHIKSNLVQTDINLAVKDAIKNSTKPIRIFSTYTAMFAIRKLFTGKSIS